MKGMSTEFFAVYYEPSGWIRSIRHANKTYAELILPTGEHLLEVTGSTTGAHVSI